MRFLKGHDLYVRRLQHYKSQKKTSDITEDDLKDIEKDIQTITDDYIKEVDVIASKKEKDILEV